MSVRDVELPVADRVPPPGLRGYVAKALSVMTSQHWPDRGLVQQSFAVEVDINTIMKRFGATGEMPSGSAAGMYGDFTGIVDYESAVEAVERAERGFMALPPEVRERFQNDPGQLIYFAQTVSEQEFSEAVAPSSPAVPPAAPPPVEGGGGS